MFTVGKYNYCDFKELDTLSTTHTISSWFSTSTISLSRS